MNPSDLDADGRGGLRPSKEPRTVTLEGGLPRPSIVLRRYLRLFRPRRRQIGLECGRLHDLGRDGLPQLLAG